MKEPLREAVSSDILADSTSVPTPEQPESATSSAEHQLFGTKDEEKLSLEDDSKKAHWPSMVDLNTRLRRVITSYQRNFKKEEMRLAQKAKVWLVQNVYFSSACPITSLHISCYVTVEAAVSDFNILNYKPLNVMEFINASFQSHIIGTCDLPQTIFEYSLTSFDTASLYCWFPDFRILETPKIMKEISLTT